MCGIAGFIGFRDNNHHDRIAKCMGAAIHHRGPDSSGVWIEDKDQVALVHQRLSILDLSDAGHQPMISKQGRFVVVFNGEIYNHLEIRKRLNNFDWIGTSDTETLLSAVEEWGLEKALQQFEGMFAFALWDKKKKTLTIARDRVGEKPLYYGVHNQIFLFGSELKALMKHPEFIGDIDRNSISLQMQYSYIPAPYSIYKGIKKLMPGSYIEISVSHGSCEIGVVKEYWKLADDIKKGLELERIDNEIVAIQSLDKVLSASIKDQMISDVPIGAFLSGGIDSSVVVSMMQKESMKPVKTFSIGFHEKEYNEAHYANDVAQHLGTDHTELYVTPEQAMEVIPKIPEIYDEPFSDSSQIPTYLVSELTKRHVTVSLSGDAGDELFGGYNRYLLANSTWNKINKIPNLVRKFSSKSILSIPPERLNQMFNAAKLLLPKKWDALNLGDKLHKGAAILNCNSQEELYQKLISHWDPSLLVIDISKQDVLCMDLPGDYPEISHVEKMMALDTLTYLPDDILVKVDRAAMAVSLETRVPFLNPKVIEFAWRLPISMKIKNGETKWVLKQVLNDYVPKELTDRPKMGFGVPIDRWLRGPLKSWAESLLDESKLKQEGYFHSSLVRRIWLEHLSGKRNWQYHLWDVLMFQLWLNNHKEFMSHRRDCIKT
jgi:asparagine synthase (glutamine-hydrolysing)